MGCLAPAGAERARPLGAAAAQTAGESLRRVRNPAAGAGLWPFPLGPRGGHLDCRQLPPRAFNHAGGGGGRGPHRPQAALPVPRKGPDLCDEQSTRPAWPRTAHVARRLLLRAPRSPPLGPAATTATRPVPRGVWSVLLQPATPPPPAMARQCALGRTRPLRQRERSRGGGSAPSEGPFLAAQPETSAVGMQPKAQRRRVLSPSPSLWAQIRARPVHQGQGALGAARPLSGGRGLEGKLRCSDRQMVQLPSEGGPRQTHQFKLFHRPSAQCRPARPVTYNLKLP